MPYTRKLQKIGESLFVSLPKIWIKRMQLDKGDLVMLIEQPDYSVVIHPGVKNESLKQIILDVDVEESKWSIRRRVTGAYVDGFDVIKLRAVDRFTEEQQDVIRETIAALFGLEIIELTSNSVTIQCLLAKRLPIESTMQRLHNIIKSMFSETVIALRERNPEAVKGVIKRTEDVRRLTLVLHRLLRSVLLFPIERTPEMKPIDSVDFLRVIDKIAEVSRSIKKIGESVARWELSFPDSILEPLLVICAKILELYDFSMQALMSKDVPLANRVLDEKMEPRIDELWETVLEAEEKAEISGPTFSYTLRIVDNLKQMCGYSLEIAEIAIDRAEELS